MASVLALSFPGLAWLANGPHPERDAHPLASLIVPAMVFALVVHTFLRKPV
jgi:hypothetical protein